MTIFVSTGVGTAGRVSVISIHLGICSLLGQVPLGEMGESDTETLVPGGPDCGLTDNQGRIGRMVVLVMVVGSVGGVVVGWTSHRPSGVTVPGGGQNFGSDVVV